MRQNEIDTFTFEIVTDALNIGNAEAQVKTSKVETRKKADTLVNWFIEESTLDEMKQHLTESFESMDRKLVFGVKGIKTKGGTDLVTLKKNSAAKFIQRSFNSLSKEDRQGLVLSGYAPFKLTEEVPTIEATEEEKLVECLESIGADITCILECTASLSSSTVRREARLIERDKAMAKAQAEAKKDADLIEQDQTIDKLLALMGKGLTMADIEKITAEKLEAEQA